MTNTRYAVAVLVGLILFSVPLWADPSGRVGRLSFLEGNVTISSGDAGETQAAAVNYPLTAGDQLQTAAGARAEVQVGSSAIRLDGDTHVTFDSLDDQAVQLRLDRGSVSVRLRRLDDGQTFEIAAQGASVSLPVPGAFRVDQRENGDLDVTARSGDAEVTTGQEAVTVRSGQALFVPMADPARYTIAQAPAPDSWDAWVATRDRRAEQSVSTRYVSSEVEGVTDLDADGTWRVIDGYGPCWVPNVFAGWAPYHYGRWAWVAPWGWTWIDDARWGFAPFHYGRWAFTTGVWVWVPGPIVVRPVWAPALVTWRGGIPGRRHPPDPRHVTWMPLRPHQAYSPAYPVGPSYVRAVNNGFGAAGARPVVRPAARPVVRPVVRPAARPVVRPAPDSGTVVVRPDHRAPVRPAPAQAQERPVYRPAPDVAVPHPPVASRPGLPAPVIRARQQPSSQDQDDPRWRKKREG
jgi:hypothetical protein